MICGRQCEDVSASDDAPAAVPEAGRKECTRKKGGRRTVRSVCPCRELAYVGLLFEPTPPDENPKAGGDGLEHGSWDCWGLGVPYSCAEIPAPSPPTAEGNVVGAHRLDVAVTKTMRGLAKKPSSLFCARANATMRA